MGPSRSSALAILVSVAACVSYPEPEIQAPPAADAAMAPGEAVTVLSGSRTYEQASIAQCVHGAMVDAEPEFEIMPGGNFRDALFPWFEPGTAPANSDELAVLLARPAVEGRIEELAVRYVIVTDGHTTGETEGFFLCGASGTGAGCLGLSWVDRESRVTAAVWDLERGASAGQLTANTAGTSVAIGVLVPIFFFSDTQTAACEGLGARLARFVTGKSPAAD